MALWQVVPNPPAPGVLKVRATTRLGLPQSPTHLPAGMCLLTWTLMHWELSLSWVQLTLRPRLWRTSGKFPDLLCVPTFMSQHVSAFHSLTAETDKPGTWSCYLYTLAVNTARLHDCNKLKKSQIKFKWIISLNNISVPNFVRICFFLNDTILSILGTKMFPW